MISSKFKFNHLFAIFPRMAQNMLLTQLEPLGNEFTWSGTEAYPSSCADGERTYCSQYVLVGLTGNWLQVLAGNICSSHFEFQGKMISGRGNCLEREYPYSDPQPSKFLLFFFFLSSNSYFFDFTEQNKNPQAPSCQQPLRWVSSGLKAHGVPATQFGCQLFAPRN